MNTGLITLPRFCIVPLLNSHESNNVFVKESRWHNRIYLSLSDGDVSMQNIRETWHLFRDRMSDWSALFILKWNIFFFSVIRLISSPFWAPKNMVLHTADRIRNTFDARSDTSSLRVQMVSLIREVNPCESKEVWGALILSTKKTLHA